MSGIFEQLVEQNTKIISLLEVIAASYGKVEKSTPAKELVVGQDIGEETDASTLDSRGFPWDSRIHSSAKSFNADGTWKYMRGLDKAVTLPNVENELRAAGFGSAVEEEVEEVQQPLAAPVAAATPGLPPIAAPVLPPVIAAPAIPAKVEFPEIADETNVSDAELTQTAAALLSKHGADVLKNLLTAFGVAAGGTALQVPDTHRYVFWQYASNDEFLRAQTFID